VFSLPGPINKMNPESPFAAGKVLLIDKPLGWTSFDVVRKLRHLIRIKKIGHAGTLDPLATGLLIVCTGKFTKRINEFMAQEKEYTGTITLGAVTPSYDLETEPVDHRDISHVSLASIQEAMQVFIGSILQVPPAHSAIKVKGKRVYELARKGQCSSHGVSLFLLSRRPDTVKVFCILGRSVLPEPIFEVWRTIWELRYNVVLI